MYIQTDPKILCKKNKMSFLKDEKLSILNFHLSIMFGEIYIHSTLTLPNEFKPSWIKIKH